MACWKEKEKLYTKIFRESFSKLYDSSQKSTFQKRQARHCRNSNNFFSDLVVAKKNLINKKKSNKRASSYKIKRFSPWNCSKATFNVQTRTKKTRYNLHPFYLPPMTQWLRHLVYRNPCLRLRNYIFSVPLII